MELHSSFKDCFLLNDTSSLFYVARDLIDYRAYFGLHDFPIEGSAAFWGKGVDDGRWRFTGSTIAVDLT